MSCIPAVLSVKVFIQILKTSLVLKPEGHNTAPAIAISTMEVIDKQTVGMILVLPADHQITDIESFSAAVEKGIRLATDNNLLTFDIVPTEPHTGFGYMQAGELKGVGGYQVSQFVEKPDAGMAQSYLDDGNYY